jgi:hypothetical protein
VEWPDRTIYTQWHRGDVPELNRACAARSQRWRLVQPEGVAPGEAPAKVAFQLYDIEKDPYQLKDVADRHPDVVAKMRRGYEEWFRDVGATRGYDPPRIHLGDEREKLTVLTRQDWRGLRAEGKADSLGHWEVQVARAGSFDVTLHFAAAAEGRTVYFKLGGASLMRGVPVKTSSCTFEAVKLPAGTGRLEAWLAQGENTAGVRFVEVRRRE